MQFIFLKLLHLEAATGRAGRCSFAAAVDNFGHDPEHQSKHVLDAFNEVEWITISFVGLFIVVHEMERHWSQDCWRKR